MTDTPPSLLPKGLYDLLPPRASLQAACAADILNYLGNHGYETVSPPLAEFESTLFPEGLRAGLRRQTFRFLDPESKEMLGLRADMTTQIARLAATRMGHAPRPLRLAYAGEVLRVQGDALHPGRQTHQVGFELIGAPSVAADAEVVALALRLLERQGLEGLSVDLNMPGLLEALFPETSFSPALRTAMAGKRMPEVAQLLDEAGIADPVRTCLYALMETAGQPAEAALERLSRVPELTETAASLQTFRKMLDTLLPDVNATIDLTESRGFGYYTGIAFAIFTAGASGELARGGRYTLPVQGGLTHHAAGCAFDAGMIAELASAPVPPARILVPGDLPLASREALQKEGYATISAIAEVNVPEARRMQCDAIYEHGKIRPL